MAFLDFRHYRAPEGAIDMLSYPANSGATFQAGEPIVVSALGVINECGSNPPVVDGIAAHKVLDVDGNALGIIPTAVYGTGSGQVFITRRFSTDGAGTPATPLLNSIGDTAGFVLASGVWYLDTAATNKHAEVIGVHDAHGNNLSDPNVLPGTGVWVLFKFL